MFCKCAGILIFLLCPPPDTTNIRQVRTRPPWPLLLSFTACLQKSLQVLCDIHFVAGRVHRDQPASGSLRPSDTTLMEVAVIYERMGWPRKKNASGWCLTNTGKLDVWCSSEELLPWAYLCIIFTHSTSCRMMYFTNSSVKVMVQYEVYTSVIWIFEVWTWNRAV